MSQRGAGERDWDGTGEVNGDLLEVLEIVNPVSRHFADAGYQLYLVGGVVRDIALGAHGQFDDIDLTTDARPAEIKRLFKRVSSSLWTQGERFGTIGAIVNGRDLEITTHRAETYDPDSRKPKVVFGDDLKADLSRRDFSINAMAYSVITKELHDPFGGMADLERQRLRTPDDPEISFVDDPLRMLRAARFVPRFSLSVDPDLERAVVRLGERLSIVSAERVHDELERLLEVPDPSLGFDFLERTGLLDFIVPGLNPVTRPRACEAASRSNSVAVRRAGLLDSLGIEGAGSWLSKLRYSTVDRRLTLNLMRGAGSLLDSENSAADLRRLTCLVGIDHIDDALELAQNLASIGVANPSDSSAQDGFVGGQRLAQARSILAELRRTEDLADLVSPVSGGELIEELGMRPGPLVGRAVAMLGEHRLSGGPFDKAEAFRLTREWLANSAQDHP